MVVIVCAMAEDAPVRWGLKVSATPLIIAPRTCKYLPTQRLTPNVIEGTGNLLESALAK